jgi:hypothetical protein
MPKIITELFNAEIDWSQLAFPKVIIKEKVKQTQEEFLGLDPESPAKSIQKAAKKVANYNDMKKRIALKIFSPTSNATFTILQKRIEG